jgi:toxin FitB
LTAGLLDTSVLVAGEGGGAGELPEELAISVMTLAELHVGVLLASDPDVRARRLELLAEVEREFDPLPVDDAVARRFAALVSEARRQGRRPKVTDALIAATAAAHDLVLYTRDRGFRGLEGVRVCVVG